jgi:hypothetical protein
MIHVGCVRYQARLQQPPACTFLHGAGERQEPMARILALSAWSVAVADIIGLLAGNRRNRLMQPRQREYRILCLGGTSFRSIVCAWKQINLKNHPCMPMLVVQASSYLVNHYRP